MKVLVDTCVWSQVLRYNTPNHELSKIMTELINNGLVVIIGQIRQELLSGISGSRQFNELKKMLSAFNDIQLNTTHFEKAAEFNNICRAKGVQGSSVDFIICAVAHLESLYIFTTDRDFENYQKYLPIKLFEVKRNEFLAG